MQRTLYLLLIISISSSSFAQSAAKTTTPRANPITCDEREAKLRTALGASSAVLVYNTYVAIGAVSDSYVYKGYNDEKLNSLFNEQKTVLDQIDNEFIKLISEKTVFEKSDVSYIQELSSIIKGLKKQIDFFQEYVKDKTEARTTTFNDQRKKNWDKIAKLLAFEN